MKIILTGASGNLGRAILERLLLKKHCVLAVCHNKIVDGVECVLESSPDFQNRFIDFKADALIHAAAKYGRNNESITELAEANILFGLRILEMARKNKIRKFLLIGTALEKNVSAYSLSKNQLTEWAYRMYDKTELYDIRLQQFYGENCDTSNFISALIRDCQKAKEINLTEGRQKRDLIYAGDVVSAFEVLLKTDKSPQKPIEIGSGQSYPIREIAEYIKYITRSNVELNFGAVAMRENEPMDCKADTAFLESLGWRCRYIDYKEGIKNMLKGVI